MLAPSTSIFTNRLYNLQLESLLFLKVVCCENAYFQMNLLSVKLNFHMSVVFIVSSCFPSNKGRVNYEALKSAAPQAPVVSLDYYRHLFPQEFMAVRFGHTGSCLISARAVSPSLISCLSGARCRSPVNAPCDPDDRTGVGQPGSAESLWSRQASPPTSHLEFDHMSMLCPKLAYAFFTLCQLCMFNVITSILNARLISDVVTRVANCIIKYIKYLSRI